MTTEQAKINENKNTDNYASFDRSVIRGRVSTSYQNTRPSSSASTASGVSIGGEKNKDDSNLISLGTLKSDNSEEDIEMRSLEEFNKS